MSKYYKIDKDARKITIDKNHDYNVNVNILDLIIDLQQELDKYKTNWEELKKWLYETKYLYVPLIAENSPYTEIFKNMLEMEKD